MASAAKSGAVLSARIVADIGVACGLCVASGERSAPGIPGPVEDLPVYDGKILHAIINMRTWPEYVTKQGYDISTLLKRSDTNKIESSPIATSTSSSKKVRCVTIIRDPLGRLRSLYTYARSGGEHWFRYESGIMQELNNPILSLEESVDLFWNKFGRDYLIQSHEFMFMNIELGCVPIKMEALGQNFTESMTQIFQVYGISEKVIPDLLARVSSADLNTKSEAQRATDAHVTANKFSVDLITNLKKILIENVEVRDMVKQQRLELGY